MSASGRVAPEYNGVMKVSSNPSLLGIRVRWHCLRLAAIAVALAAIWFPNRVGELIGLGIALFSVAYVLKASEEDLLIEVFDDGDRLRFEQGEIRFSVGLTEIEKVTYKEANDGMDIVVISVLPTIAFGRFIEFIPQPGYKFDCNGKLWFDDLQKRIAEARSIATAKDVENSVDVSFELFSPSGQNWM
jgi:hypothetical protein